MRIIDLTEMTETQVRALDHGTTDGGWPTARLQRFEKIPCRVFRHAREASHTVAAEIAALIRGRAAEGRNCVLGLATGSTPIGVYAELVRLHQHEGLSFRNVVTFNLDEYYPMPPEELQSYVRFMGEHLFDHVDIEPQNIHIPDGTHPEDQVDDYCRCYEEAIRDAGGIDLQLLGIGRTGHIGFNEPGSSRDSRTRMITLDRVTRRDARCPRGREPRTRPRSSGGVPTIARTRPRDPRHR